MPNERIAILMSGGVDSSVAAALLKEQSHDLIGLTYNIGHSAVSFQRSAGKYTPAPDPRARKAGGTRSAMDGSGGCRPLAPAKRCCGMDDMKDASTIAFQLGIPHYVLNVADSFGKGVIGDFIDSYLKGETPLPCAHCNTRVKWGEVADRAKALGAGRIATGHYARVAWDESRNRFLLMKAKDPEKDQSYFLFGLSQEQLAVALFPLGDLTKREVRRRAQSMGLVVSDKKDSQELCFVPSGHYSDLVRGQGPGARDQECATGDRRPTTVDDCGDIVDSNGRVLGTHSGYFKFTVGQRRGLGLSGGPYYVKSIDAASRRVVVGKTEEMLTDRLFARNPNLIGFESWEAIGRVRARIRYRHEGEWGSVRWDGRKLQVEFEKPVRAVAPGQAVVFYHEDEVVGGAWITGQC